MFIIQNKIVNYRDVQNKSKSTTAEKTSMIVADKFIVKYPECK
jgi:hypothetical protein